MGNVAESEEPFRSPVHMQVLKMHIYWIFEDRMTTSLLVTTVWVCTKRVCLPDRIYRL